MINIAVEGHLDEGVAIKILEHLEMLPNNVYGKSGKPSLLEKIKSYNSAAK